MTHLFNIRPLAITCLLACYGIISLPVMAEEAVKTVPVNLLEAIQQGKSMTNFRLRYEHVDQEPLANKAHAFTLRSLIGWQTAPLHNFSLAAQLTDVHEFNHNFNDRRDNLSEPGKVTYPNIVDPSYTGINQLYVDWTGVKNTKLRLGRQQVNLDNVRFIGDIGFRQNMQVFDGVSVLNKSLPDTELFVAHFDNVRQINTARRSGNIDIVNAKYRLASSTSLVAYGYLIDVANLSQNNGDASVTSSTAAQAGNGLGASQDLITSATTDASNKTLGLRLDGSAKISQDWKVLYTAEYAKQDDYRGGSNLIDADYYKLGAGLVWGTWSLRLDHETLSSNGGRYAFQTPLGTNHLFQGWVDAFLVTPRQGIKDTFVSVSGNIEKVKLYAEYHVIKSDTPFASLTGLGNEYGHEFDASMSYPVSAKLNAKLEYAKFTESDVYGTSLTAAVRKGDKEIVWVTAMYTF
ncbi:MAG: alginate export family protein [Sulfuritalea sp.]|jgi:hypothetical protein|nr:alginate export family protein [Sulfuritalea sp.]